MKKIVTIMPEITREEAIKEMLDGRTVTHTDYGENNYYCYYDANNTYPFRSKNAFSGQIWSMDFNAEHWYRCIVQNVDEFKKGGKVLVKNTQENFWHRRYFVRYDKKTNHYITWANGGDEWSSDGVEVSWDQCKKWEGENE